VGEQLQQHGGDEGERDPRRRTPGRGVRRRLRVRLAGSLFEGHAGARPEAHLVGWDEALRSPTEPPTPAGVVGLRGLAPPYKKCRTAHPLAQRSQYGSAGSGGRGSSGQASAGVRAVSRARTRFQVVMNAARATHQVKTKATIAGGLAPARGRANTPGASNMPTT